MKESTYIPALKYSFLTKLYDPIMRFTMPEKQFKAELIKQANIQPNYNVLDFGCGSLTLSLLVKANIPNANVIGVDVDEKILSISREKVKQHLADIKIDKYDGVVLPYSDSSFDRVLTSLVFHHLTPEQKVNSLFEIKRVLKSGGELHIADWGKASSLFMRSLFLFIQLLDGFKTTKDNVKGLLPQYLKEAGFSNILITKEYNTIFGTLQLFQSLKNN